MSTKQTQNYGLHLWEPEDKFLRTEFNENSTKLDAALKAHDKRMDAQDTRMDGLEIRPAYTYLQTYTTTASATQIDLDVSKIDWSRWEQVVIKAHFLGYGQMRACPNSEITNSYTVSNAAYTGISGGLCLVAMSTAETYGTMTLLSGKNPNKSFECLFWGNGVFQYGHHLGVKFSSVATLRFFFPNSGSFDAGTSFEFWGIG